MTLPASAEHNMTAMPACFRSLLLIGFFPFSNGSVGAVDAHAPCIFLFDGGAVVTYAFVGQSYGAVAAGAVTNRRGVASWLIKNFGLTFELRPRPVRAVAPAANC